MPEMPDVVTLTTISSDWGNDIRDRTVQRYSSVANRTTEHPSPAEGDLSYLEDNGDVEVYDGSSWRRVGVPAGSISMFGGTSAPLGWLLCDGTAVSRTTYAVLFGILGTTYGAGNGSTTFNLPDLRQRFPLGKAVSGTGAALGATGGNIDHIHTQTAHRHGSVTGTEPAHAHGGETEEAGSLGAIGGETFQTGSNSHLHTFTTSAGGGHDHAIGLESPAIQAANPPFLTVNFIVKT